jgi:hypothetical protein
VTGDPIEADKSNFLHPVIYYYRQPPGKGTPYYPGIVKKCTYIYSILASTPRKF